LQPVYVLSTCKQAIFPVLIFGQRKQLQLEQAVVKFVVCIITCMERNWKPFSWSLWEISKYENFKNTVVKFI